jgi:adenylylsulfate kinase
MKYRQLVEKGGEYMESSCGSVLWFTGLSGSGKTTSAQHIYHRLEEEGRPVELLDGDVIRTAICKGLGFSREDRLENVRRIAYVADLLASHGVTVLVSAITPYREMREYLRSHVTGYVEIYVSCSLEVCEARDVKGLYAKARRQEIAMFTGISDSYEVPEQPDIVIDTQRDTVELNTNKVVDWLAQHVWLAESVHSSIAASKEIGELAGSKRAYQTLEGQRG